MKAVVMAGGEGSRLRPLTLNLPKPMMPLVNKPMLSHIFDLLKRHGITEVVVTVHYMANRIQDYYGDGSQIGMKIEYSVEEVPLGTAGSVKQASRLLDETFLVISGDALTNFDLSHIIRYHQEKGGLATLTLTRVPNPLEYGVVQTYEDGRIHRLTEKPGWSDVVSDTVNTGIYVLEPRVLDRIEDGEVFDFSHDLFQEMIEENAPLYGCVVEGYWTDVGRFEEYRRATDDMLHGVVRIDPLGTEIRPGVWAGGEVDIAPDANLQGPIYFGPGVQIKSGVTVIGPSVIRDNVVVDNRATIERSIIYRNCYIGERVEVRGAILALQSAVKARAMIFEGVIVSHNTTIRENAIIQPNVKIWPEKEVEAGATITTSLVYGSQGRRNLFGHYGVTGLVNVELTPEFCAKLGAAFGATLRKGSTVTINRAAHNTARVLKRALLSGMPSAGTNVLDTANLPIPVFRYYTRVTNAAGGVHVRLSPYDQRVVDIKFIGEGGLDLSQRAQRSMENVFFREDIRRVYLDEIGQIMYATDDVALYEKAFKAALQPGTFPLATRYDHVVVDYANSTTSLVLPDILNSLKCDIVGVGTLLDQHMLVRSKSEWAESMSRLAAITHALGANFGVRLDVGGERVFFTSNDGMVIPDMEALVAMTTLVCMAVPNAGIGVPVTAPLILETIAAQYGGTIHRQRLGDMVMMEEATHNRHAMIGDGEGGFIFPAFSPFLDGMFTIVKVMELTTHIQQSFSAIWRARRPFHIAKGMLPCRWEQKGKMMRMLRERFPAAENEAVEGVQIPLGDEWVLIYPDPADPHFVIHAEAADDSSATALVEKYRSLVNSLLS